jgi:hypothetical protein
MNKPKKPRYIPTAGWLRLQAIYVAKRKNVKLTKYEHKPTDTNGLTRCITDFLKLSGHQAERINTTGVFVQGKATPAMGGLATIRGKGYFRPTTATKGSADISCIIKTEKLKYGAPIKIEVKFGKDRLRPEQVAYGKDVKESKGLYWVVKDFEQFIKLYDDFILENS